MNRTHAIPDDEGSFAKGFLLAIPVSAALWAMAYLIVRAAMTALGA